MKRLTACLFFLYTCLVASAQYAGVPERFDTLHVNRYSKVPSFVVFNPGNLPDAANPEEWIGANFRSDDNFHLQLVKSATDAGSGEHKKYRQIYKGIPVEGAILNLHLKAGIPYSLNGEFYPLLKVPEVKSMSEQAALSVALAEFPGALFAWQRPAWEKMLVKTSKGKETTYYPKAELVILPLAKDSVTFHLAYKFNIYALSPLSRKLVYIDAYDGAVLEAVELLQDMDQKGKACTKYSGVQTITCDAGIVYTLQESCRGGGIATFNAGGIFSGVDPSLFEDDDNVWNNVNPEQDEIATDLHWGLEKTYDFYQDVLGRKSIDDKDYNLIALGHIQPVPGEKFDNAMWDGNYAFFGDGNDTSMNPLASIDIVGHEISHGLTQETAGLQYKDEPGALNESFSDILGKSIEHYTTPEGFSWELGKKIMWPRKPAMRNMKNPNSVKDPKFYNGKYFHAGPSDNGGVHCNSALQNYWFYLLCEGGSGFRESDIVPFLVKPLGWDKAIKIVYLNLTAYLTPNSEYKDAALGSVEAAKFLFGAASDEAYEVQMAWYGIGVLDKPEKKVPASLTEITSPAITIYPNPVSDAVTIISGQPLQQAQLSIFDPMGRLVLQKEGLSGARNTIDLSAQIPGIYFVELKEQGNVTRKKLIKQ